MRRSTGWGSGDADLIRFRLSRVINHAGSLERGSDRCSQVRVPGGAVLHCWDGGAAQTASKRKVGGDSVTKVILSYNGRIIKRPTVPFRRCTAPCLHKVPKEIPMNQLNSSGADNQGADVVAIACSSCGYFEEHFTKNGQTKVGRPCDQCRK